ncbi:MAG: hypothetical protein ACF8R7_06280 [Phycisphaerales bacterium JB039]
MLTRRNAATAALILAACAGARAQCDVYRTHIPDFDQRRLDSGGAHGLPDAGDMYCVPTSAINIMGYIANSGYPEILGGSPQFWQADEHYNYITDMIELMGALMDTDKDGGTTGDGHVAGLEDWITALAPGKFVVVRKSTSGAYAPTPVELWWQMGTGAMVNISIGKYESDGSKLTRVGGHVATLWRVTGGCAATPNIGYRDPWTESESLTKQSTFSSTSGDLLKVHSTFKYGDSDPEERDMWRLMNYTTSSRYLDAITMVVPVFGLTTDPTLEKYQIYFPGSLGAPTPKTKVIDLPGTAIAVALSADLIEAHAILTDAAGGASLVTYNRAEEAFADPIDLGSATALATDRQGDVWVASGARIRRGSARHRAFFIVDRTVPTAIDAMAYHDGEDLMYCVSGARARLMALTRDGDVAMSLALPTTVGLAGAPSLAIDDRAGAIWLTSAGSGAIYRLGRDAAGGWMVVETVDLATGVSPESLQVSDTGSLLYASGGVLHEIERGPTGGWIPAPGSDFDGQPSGALFALARSRNNLDDTMTGPGFINLVEGELGAGTPDCYADCDTSSGVGVLDFFDFLCFQNAFAAGDPYAVDCDTSGGLGVGDFFDFLCFQNAFAAGCSQ